MTGGEVYFYKSDILKYKNEKPRLIHEGPHSITALSFKNVGKNVLVFVATEYTIITITISGKDRDEKVRTVNRPGFAISCLYSWITWTTETALY